MVTMGYPDQCRACQLRHLGPNKIGPAASDKISSRVEQGFPALASRPGRLLFRFFHLSEVYRKDSGHLHLGEAHRGSGCLH